MNSTERSAHPSAAQIDVLLEFLERNPSLAKGYMKTQSAREQARRQWERLALRINSMGGAVKTSKQWTKYWSDKKSATKKKSAAIAAARRKTGGGIEEVVELSEVENRIVALLGGESFSTGDMHVGIQPFPEPTVSASPLQHISREIGTTEESIIPLPRSPASQENIAAVVLEPEQPDNGLQETRRTVTARRLFVNAEEDIPHTQSQSILHSSLHGHILQSPTRTRPHSLHPSPSSYPIPSPPHPTLSRTPTPLSLPRPSRSTRTDPTSSAISPSRRETTSQVSRASTRRALTRQGAGSSSSHRTRPIGRQASPPSQRRTEFSRITERFLMVEEQQIEIQRSHVRLLEALLEQSAEREQRLVQAVTAMGEGLKALAEAINR